MEDSDPWANTPSTPKLDNSRPATPTLTKSPISNHGRMSVESPLKDSSPIASVPIEEVNSSAHHLALDDFDTGAGAAREGSGAGEGDDGFDDFDDFDQPAIAGPSSASTKNDNDGFGDVDVDGDGFGDFGDFEEGDFDEPSEVAVVAEPEIIQERWHALRLRPLPPRSELLDQLSSVLEPLYDPSSHSSNQYLTDERPRISTGLSQVLVSESSRDAYAQLTTAPMLKPLDWTRSRVRREHLISMGVPVNLDEVDSHRLSALPPLRITTMGPPGVPRRAESLDVNGNGNDRYTAIQKGKGKGIETSPINGNGSQSVPSSAGGYNSSSGPGGGVASKALGQYGLGQQPELDQARAEELCGLEEGQLSILPIATLRKMQEELVTNTAQASALLAWLLQMRDAQTQDSATYNGMISELIANAAKVKSAQAAGSGGVFRRASTKQRPQSASGTVTPRRTASPGMWS